MINALRAPSDRRWYDLSLAAAILSAWVALAAWGASPYAELLGHNSAGSGTLPLAVRVAMFVVGWTLMTIAMMLPSSLPLANLFRRLVADRPDRGTLVLLLAAGDVAVWAEFGLLAFLGDSVLHAAVAGVPALGSRPGIIAAIILLVAGLYQFTPLKAWCLDTCRSPLSFLGQHWSGRGLGRDALRLGVRHGLFCLGCCWTLMLLMFAIGGISLVWMLGLGALMAAERTTHLGSHLTRPLGIGLVAWACLHLTGMLPFPAS